MKQKTLFNTYPDKKLKRKFNKYVKKYHRFCINYGRTSGDLGTLISFFHNNGFVTGKDLIRDNSKYYLEYQGHCYNLEDLILIFRREIK